jgi:hypothetical protein
MFSSAYERLLKLNSEITATHTSVAKLWFNAMDVWSFGSLEQYSNSFDKWLDFYQKTYHSMASEWPDSTLVTAGSIYTVAPLTTEQEIMQRHTPDYSNLRAAAQGDHAQSIIDNDAYWQNGIQGSNAKSPNKMGTDRERTRFDQLLNETE